LGHSFDAAYRDTTRRRGDVGKPHVKHLRGKLWEMRMKGRDGIGRAIYVVAKGQRVVVVHAFTKKTEKTPKSALELAEARAKEVG
jgi:phage-related protein